jgi:hypothetical protein
MPNQGVLSYRFIGFLAMKLQGKRGLELAKETNKKPQFHLAYKWN